eukprot:349759-Chlamydomonas_euryale.AAC.14
MPHPLKGPSADHRLRRGSATLFTDCLKPVAVCQAMLTMRRRQLKSGMLVCPFEPPFVSTLCSLTRTCAK